MYVLYFSNLHNNTAQLSHSTFKYSWTFKIQDNIVKQANYSVTCETLTFKV